MLRVGLTGGIGAGKSTVAGRLAELGAVVVDADRLAREVLAPGGEGLAEVRSAFGDAVITPDGALDRARLAGVVFADPAARARLEAITHPRIATRTTELFAAAERERGAGVVVVHDVPLLVENRLGANYHLVIVVHAGQEQRVRRLVDDRGMSESDARARIAAQADDDARRAEADIWWANTRGVTELLDQVDTTWQQRVAPFAANLAGRRPASGTGRAPAPDGVARERLLARLHRSVTGAGGQVQVQGTDFVVRTVEGLESAPPVEVSAAVVQAFGLVRAAIEAAGYAPVPGQEGENVNEYLTCDPGWPGTTVRIESSRRFEPAAGTW